MIENSNSRGTNVSCEGQQRGESASFGPSSVGSSETHVISSSRHCRPLFSSLTMEKQRRLKARRVLDKLAVSSEPGLTNAQLMLTNHDLKPGKYIAIRKEIWEKGNWPDSTVSGTRTSSMGSMEFRGILDCRFFQHCAFRSLRCNTAVIC